MVPDPSTSTCEREQISRRRGSREVKRTHGEGVKRSKSWSVQNCASADVESSIVVTTSEESERSAIFRRASLGTASPSDDSFGSQYAVDESSGSVGAPGRDSVDLAVELCEKVSQLVSSWAETEDRLTLQRSSLA